MYEDGIEAPYPKKGTINDPNTASFEEALRRTGYGWCQKKATFLGGMVILCSYISVAAISYLLPVAQCDLEMDSYRKGTLVSAGLLGIIFSCHTWGFLSDTLGRRYIIIRCIFVDGMLYIITSFMPYFSLWVIMRFLQGVVSSGAVVPAYAYIGEFHTDQYRKKALVIAALIGSLAYIGMPVFAWMVMSFDWELKIFPWLIYKPWRLFYGMLGLISLFCAFALFSLPESPKFLLAAGKEEQAIDALKRIHDQNGSKALGPFNIKNLIRNYEEHIAKLENSTNKVLGFFSLVWRQTAPLFSSAHRRNIALICFTQFLLYFTNNGMVLWLPETTNRVAKFIEANGEKSSSFCYIIENSHGHQMTTTSDNSTGEPACIDTVNTTVYISTFTTGSALTASLLLVTILIKYINQKVVICISIITSFILLVVINFTEGTYILIYEMIALILPISAVIPVITNTVVDLFPTNIRGMAMCLTLLSARFGTIMANQVAGILIDGHCKIMMLLFTGAIGVSVVISFILPTNPGSTGNCIKDLHDDVNHTSVNDA